MYAKGNKHTQLKGEKEEREESERVRERER